MFTFDVSHLIQLKPEYKIGANFDANAGLPDMLHTFRSLPKDPRSAVLCEGSWMLARYYAYRSEYPVRATSQDTLMEELNRYLFCPLFVVSKNGPLGIETLPDTLGPLWTGHPIASEGNYCLWMLRPNEEKYRIPSTLKNTAAALIALSGHPATVVEKPACTELTMTGQIRDEIPAHITSCWTSIVVYKESTHYAIEGIPQWTELRISAEEATRILQQKNPAIAQLKIVVSQPDQLTITGSIFVGRYSIPFVLKFSPVLYEHSEILLSKIRLTAGNYVVPELLCNLFEKYASLQDLRLPHWTGTVHKIGLDPSNDNRNTSSKLLHSRKTVIIVF